MCKYICVNIYIYLYIPHTTKIGRLSGEGSISIKRTTRVIHEKMIASWWLLLRPKDAFREILGSFLMARLVVNDFWTFCWPSLAYCLGDPAKTWKNSPGRWWVYSGWSIFWMHKRFSIVVGIGIDTNSLDLEHILVTWWIPKGSTFQAKKPCWPLGCFWGMAFPLDFLDFLATVEKHLQTLQW